VHIHCAYTEQVNPEGSDPVLSRDQVGILNNPCYVAKRVLCQMLVFSMMTWANDLS
jgi:hypothetical protein